MKVLVARQRTEVPGVAAERVPDRIGFAVSERGAKGDAARGRHAANQAERGGVGGSRHERAVVFRRIANQHHVELGADARKRIIDRRACFEAAVGNVAPSVEHIFGRLVDPRALDAQRIEELGQLAAPAADIQHAEADSEPQSCQEPRHR